MSDAVRCSAPDASRCALDLAALCWALSRRSALVVGDGLQAVRRKEPDSSPCSFCANLLTSVAWFIGRLRGRGTLPGRQPSRRAPSRGHHIQTIEGRGQDTDIRGSRDWPGDRRREVWVLGDGGMGNIRNHLLCACWISLFRKPFMGRAFGPYIPPVNELFADHRLPRQGKRRRHTNEHLSFISLSLHNAERHRAPLPLAALFKSNSGRFEHRCVALSASSRRLF